MKLPSHSGRGIHERRFGFTLFELLVAISILTMVTGAIVAAFAAGVRVWSAALDVARIEEATRSELAVWAQEVMNARCFRGIPFEGEAHGMTLAVVQPMGSEFQGTFGDALGSARYWHDAQEQVLFRQARPFHPTSAGSRHEAERWIDRVETAVFEYMARSGDTPGETALAWLPEWRDRQQLPLAVRVHLTMVDGTTLTRTVVLPGRQWLGEDEA